MEQLLHKTRNPLVFFSFSILWQPLCLPNVSKNLILTQENINCLHNTMEDWQVLIGSTLYQLMERIQPKIGNPLAISFGFSLFLVILFIPNVLKLLS